MPNKLTKARAAKVRVFQGKFQEACERYDRAPENSHEKASALADMEKFARIVDRLHVSPER